MNSSNISGRLDQLRKLMRQHKIDYYYVPSADAHNNEYVPDSWQRRAWISGFTGSAGEVLVGLEEADLWVDPRYILQAKQQIDPALFSVIHQEQSISSSIDFWLRKNAANKVIGIDPQLISIQRVSKWQKLLQPIAGNLKPINENLIDQIWEDQPTVSNQPIFLYPEKYAGQNATTKIKILRETLQQRQLDAHVLTMLDAIAWLFNIRGSDVQYNPLAICYALITQEKALLFIDSEKVPSQCKDYFLQHHIEILPYSGFINYLQNLNEKLLIDPSTASWWLLQNTDPSKITLGHSPISLMKACKNSIEQQGMHEAHRRDAIAMCRFLHWLENNWQGQTEITASDKLETFRREDKQCRDLSFSTISAYGDHGAIVHYFATKDTDKAIEDNSLYLIDSGGQYFAGTTDITRTVHLGTPTKKQKHHYTLVLKGHLALCHTVFPHGTTGEQLNAIAHAPLWRYGLDYGHGTGHGVGCYLCVHEGPQRITNLSTGVPLLPGMVVSNEPGVYFEGFYGIRIENLCLINKKEDLSGENIFYTFEDLTLVPYARNLIDTDLLSMEEIRWINSYHERIYQTLTGDLSRDVKSWLLEATKPI